VAYIQGGSGGISPPYQRHFLVEFLLTHWYFLLRQLKLTWSDLKGKNSGGGDILLPYTLYEPLEVICVTTWKCVD